ncbi:MAG: hypothetical protein JW940_02975 [Polyangiaceae bacterium]|nr:hypothetical protein [Polyangiaceae bacterium]
MPESAQASSTRRPLKERLQTLIVQYGQLALVVYLAIFALVLLGFVLAIRMGIKVQGAGATAGTWAAAYVATKLTQPLRIMATLALTPLVMRLWPRRKPRKEG